MKTETKTNRKTTKADLFGGALFSAGIAAAATLMGAPAANAQCAPVHSSSVLDNNYITDNTPIGFGEIEMDGSQMHALYRQYSYPSYVSGDVFLTFDLSTPTSPTLVGSWGTGGAFTLFGTVGTTLVTNNYDTVGRLNTYSIADLSNAVAQGTLDLPGGGSIRDIEEAGGFAHIWTDSGNLHIVSVADPFNPVVLDTLNVPNLRDAGTPLGGLWPVTVNGPSPQLILVDVTNPSNLSIVSTTSFGYTTNSALEPRIVGNTVIARRGGTDPTELHAFDITNPSTPTLLPTFIPYPANISFEDIEGAGLFLYAIFDIGSSGLGIDEGDAVAFDYSNPSAPTIAAIAPRISGSLSTNNWSAIGGGVFLQGAGPALSVWDITTCSILPAVTSLTPGAVTDAGGAPIQLNATATAALTYEWSKDGTIVNDGGIFSGATTPTLTIAADPAGDGLYSVKVTNPDGEDTRGVSFVGVRTSNCPGDVTGDGQVNLQDLNTLLLNFGNVCP